MTQQIVSRGAALRASAFGLVAATLVSAGIVAPARVHAQAQAQAQSDKVVAKVAGVEIRESDLAMAEEDMGQQVQQLEGAAKRDALVAYVADVILAAKAAESKKLTDQREFKSRIAFIRNKLAMEMLLVQEGKAVEKPITLGRRTSDWVEVLQGLTTADSVVLNPGNLQSGQPLVVTE